MPEEPGRARRGQAEIAREMEKLYLEYRSPMYRVALSVLRDEGLAEDAVQQSFLKIFQNFDKLDLSDCNKTKSFIVILVRNTAIDLYRKRQREGVISFEDLERPVQDRAALPEDRAIARMDGEALRRCLAGMEERYANLLMLRFYHGFQNKEIAGLLGMSQTQVAMGIYRARQKLMQMMKGGDRSGWNMTGS